MLASTQTSKRDSLRSPADQEYNGRIQDWMADRGLDIQGRLLAGGRSGVQPASPPPSKKESAETGHKAHI
ncbi:hypothetical protein ACHAPO_009974 [Fusarium lateritium]